MTNFRTRSGVWHCAAVAAACGAVACSEHSLLSAGASILQPPSHPVTTVAHLRGTLDVKAGTLSFDPISADGTVPPSGVSAAVYGDQGVTVRIYNSPVVTSAPVGGKKTYTANVGLRNLLGFRIGDEQGSSAPPDTMGIFVFTNTAPTVSGTSSPCSCTVTVKNTDGARPFTSLQNQPYWYWPELLGAANGGADTTLARKTWVFEADTQVTRFNFDVLVSTAWAAPNDSVFQVDYLADSLPDTQAKPRWRQFATSHVTEAITSGALQLNVQRSKDSLVFVRRDSVRSGTNALIEGTFLLNNGGNSAAPQAGVAIDDNTRYIALLVSDSGSNGQAKVGFVDSTGTFMPSGTVAISVATAHTYQLRKHAADSVVAYVDGVRRLKLAYAALPPTKSPGALPSAFEFGIVSTSARNTLTTWNHVTYQIGRATP